MKAFLTITFLSVLICMTGTPFAVGQDSLGTVTISYVLDRIKTIASNQIGIWIEDEGGRYIKTLFATKNMENTLSVNSTLLNSFLLIPNHPL